MLKVQCLTYTPLHERMEGRETGLGAEASFLGLFWGSLELGVARVREKIDGPGVMFWAMPCRAFTVL